MANSFISQHITMFIVIEGVDGAGKKTQTELLANKLRDMEKAVDTLSFPMYGHRSATFVEKLLNGEFGRPHDLDPYVASTMYMLDRFAHQPIIAKKLQVYDYIISDRYTTSNFIHRGAHYMEQGDEGSMRDFFSWLYDMEFQKAKLPLPDKIFFLSVGIKNIELNLQRKAAEQQRDYIDGDSHGKLDVVEKDLDYQKYSLLVGKEVLPGYFDNYIVIDCEDDSGKLLTPQAIHQKILAKVLE